MLIDSNMKNLNKSLIAYTFLFVILVLNSKSITSVDAKEFDYLKDSDKGPEYWGGKCNNGCHQSPIDLSDEKVEVAPEIGQLKRSYKPVNATINNSGHDISIQFAMEPAGSIKINDITYDLESFHWHSPSEHTINGEKFALELHMVHKNQKLNKTAVIGELYKTGEKDSFLNQMEHHIKEITDSNKEVDIGDVDPKHIQIGGNEYYRYLGSFTTPPCAEGVIWIVNKKLRSVSEEQVMLLRKAVHGNSEKNARPLQLLNDREIFLYSPKSCM